ncbi:GM12615 [Drosophila sechellia]|uniref:GM12615 n=2 Tax=Drosophila sechellia TaxID=7238 RepID=B4I0J4_DROSE|nr:GM12615 [Drosophila sechellia]
MYNARSRGSAANKGISPKRIVTIGSLLLVLGFNQVASMSLDRLALERNELPADQQQPQQQDVLVDNMKLTSIPSADSSDMYMLVPDTVASQLEDTEHVNRNSIEADPESDPSGSSASDMLMLESDSSPAMQLVELPSDITVAESQPETEHDAEHDAEQQPESIEEHVVLMKPA